MIDALKRTLVAIKDLTEQGDSPYILVAGSGGTRYYAIDSYEIMGDVVEFYRADKLVFSCKVEGSWSVVSREVADLVTEEEVLRTSKQDTEALEKLHGELHPAVATERGPGVYL